MRDGDPGLEVLLLRRNRGAGFVPDMYVFPGGRVDASDSDPRALDRLDELTPAVAAERLDLPEGDPPAIAYYMAAFRESFEETGILVGRRADGSLPRTAAEDPEVDAVRDELMADRIDFPDALIRLGCRLAGRSVEYFAHWITPRSRPRRFDTRFFAARVTGATDPIVDPREMTDARWIRPSQAVAAHGQGELPMILPTLHTLERLSGFPTAAEALASLSGEKVVTILPDG